MPQPFEGSRKRLDRGFQRCEILYGMDGDVLVDLRDETGDHQMPHEEMAKRLMAIFEADPEIPTQEGAVSEYLVLEILHWEDEFLVMAGAPRNVRR